MLNDEEKKVVLALAENDMNFSGASKMLYMHRNTLVYHAAKIAEHTGLNPHRFYDLVELVKMATEPNTPGA